MIDRIDIEQQELNRLAPYAAISAHSRGRKYKIDEHPLRTAYQRDRDRIVHSNAFRRMEYKTQVFVPHERDHFRTRLTHTIEVAQISRTMARNLKLNEDLAEAIALVHDLGHTPFGHSGEDALNELLSDFGGFNHNMQSLRVVDILEQNYPEYRGLNLTYEVREGIIKHETSKQLSHPDFQKDEHPTLEAALVDIADELAYNAHDVDDGLRSELLKIEELKTLEIFKCNMEFMSEESNNPVSHFNRQQIVRFLLNNTIEDVISETYNRIIDSKITDVVSLRKSEIKLVGYSDSLKPKVLELKKFLNEKLYHHPSLKENVVNARETIRKLFKRFINDNSQLPSRFQDMLEYEKPETVVTDYIAGMTDRYAELLARS